MVNLPDQFMPNTEGPLAARTSMAYALEQDGYCAAAEFMSYALYADLFDMARRVYDLCDAGVVVDEWFTVWRGIRLSKITDHIPEGFIHSFNMRLSERMNEDWKMNVDASFFRRVEKDLPPSHATWHCDADGASTQNLGDRCLTVWIPLDDVGETKPSLELIVGSHKFMKTAPRNLGAGRDDAFIAAIEGDHYTPKMVTGDALIFDHYTLHRTQQMENFQPRISAELRFTP